MLSDPEMVCYIGNGDTRDLNEAEVFLEWIYSHNEMNPEYGLKVVVRKEDSVTVGHADIVPQKVKGKEELKVGRLLDCKAVRSR